MTQYFCPVCRAPRRANLSDEIDFATHLRIFATVLAVSGVGYLYNGWLLAAKLALLYLPLWVSAEFVHWVKMREATKCKVCDFDMILYKKDWRAARTKVEAKLNAVMGGIKERTAAEAQRIREGMTKRDAPTKPEIAP